MILPDLHGVMLGDRRRNAAFARALAAAVRPGDVVLDAGCGTGLLALLAARAGAARVLALERDPALVALAREIVRRNGCSGRIEVVAGDARDPPPGGPFDLLVTETVGTFAFDEGITALVDALRPRLAPGARILPGRLFLHAAPVRWPGLARGLAAARRTAGFDYSARAEALLHTPQIRRFRPGDLLAPARAFPPVDLRRPAPAEVALEATFSVRRGRVDGIGIYFDIELYRGIRLGTGPDAPPTHWGRFVLPLPPAVVDGPLAVTVRWNGPALGRLHWSAEAAGYAAAGSTALACPGPPGR